MVVAYDLGALRCARFFASRRQRWIFAANRIVNPLSRRLRGLALAGSQSEPRASKSGDGTLYGFQPFSSSGTSHPETTTYPDATS